jgi:hypothetical protein
MSPTIRNQAKLATIALAAGVAWTAFGVGDASAQSFNVRQFRCVDGDTIRLDVSGLGNQNVCVDGSVNLDLFCACVNRSGNCPNDANKQAEPEELETQQVVEPKNGRARAEVSIPFPTDQDDDLCELGCPGGQSTELVGFETTSDATFELCLTDETGGDCSCADVPEDELLATETCTASGQTVFFQSTDEDCEALFPQD